ncbi:hypothetical protein EMIHUDRAFT_424681 [Emiliania huxleyi CCMP1516]|uniref:T-complex protein 1 subunit alpha n=2 Tax=Emiliania huxleyi TaxID=2903 RepID=A0A0D3JCW2_EMIH1|nr:hypothetical protein EMIHUDRAFT_424681 [Emiliania huxleyi CCMP1516]EOD21347.1 hypothetical protein EMIHUDRAFT_424681 [Emiliania huxleyi CCMP1516]|eukprot:XP_005773776.1 hypothetical protein EMIHUDRAFT_424681 [Emiliania huxleyi CCMP1516]
MSQLSIAGERVSGQEVRTQNVTAALSVANVVKSSLGPVGLDKMLVDDLGEVTITNDGATILDQLEVEHPAAKVLVQLSEMQDKEVGDGTTSVVILAAELLKRGNELIKDSIHATSVMAGFRLAMKESIKFIRDQMVVKTDKLGRDIAFQIAKTTLSSKIFGRESDFFANLAVDAMAMVKDVHPESGKAIYPIKSVGILKQHGGSARDSQLISGYVLQGGRAAQGMPRSVKGARIALLDIDLRKTKMAMGVSVVVTDPKKLEEIRKREADITKERIQLLINAGANVILTTKGIDDMALKYFVEANCIALRRVDRSLHDALCAVKRALESASVVPGGGCALLVIPKQLAVNAARDATDIVAKLRANHNAAQTDSAKAELRRYGLDCVSGKIQNNLTAGIIEPALSKVKMIQFATEAAITVLRIDDMIKLAPEEQGQPGM